MDENQSSAAAIRDAEKGKWAGCQFLVPCNEISADELSRRAGCPRWCGAKRLRAELEQSRKAVA